MKSFVCGGIWTGSESGILPSSKILISGGRILDITPSTDVDSHLFVIPAFVDAHCHFVWSGLESLYLDLSGTASASDLLELVFSRIELDATEQILRGRGFDESNWNKPLFPSLKELDRVTGNRPVFLRRVCCHEARVNSAMLDLLPLECQGVDYGSGIIREGIVFDFETLFPPEPQLLSQACSLATELAYSSGVTAVCTFESLLSADLLLKKRPPIRMSICLFGKDAGFPGETFPELEGILHDIDGLKFFLDGSIGASTAAVSGSYKGGAIVEPLLSDEQVLQSLEFADRLGLTPAYHAIGGRALAQLDRVSHHFLEEHDGEDLITIRVEHAEELTADWPGRWNTSIHSFVMQPNFVNRWQLSDGLYEGKLGKKRAVALNPFSLVKDAGFPLGFGSDGMPFGPLKGLGGATAHPSGKYRIDTASALNAYTIEAASICGFKDLSEHLGPGRVADMTVLSNDPFHTPWDGIEVVATISDGCVVYGLEELLEDI